LLSATDKIQTVLMCRYLPDLNAACDWEG